MYSTRKNPLHDDPRQYGTPPWRHKIYVSMRQYCMTSSLAHRTDGELSTHTKLIIAHLRIINILIIVLVLPVITPFPLTLSLKPLYFPFTPSTPLTFVCREIPRWLSQKTKTPRSFARLGIGSHCCYLSICWSLPVYVYLKSLHFERSGSDLIFLAATFCLPAVFVVVDYCKNHSVDHH